MAQWVETSRSDRRRRAPWPSVEEVEVAREVQARLLRAEAPRLATLDCRGLSVPAHAVGGDYFDILQPVEGRIVLAVGDVAGKGMSAALVMAAVHASLRSLCAARVEGLVPLLASVNHVLSVCTETRLYVTLFVAEYDDAKRVFRWINAGHPAALVVRASGEVERLASAAPPLGLFDAWEGTTGEIRLSPGDLLAACTDGVFEAEDDDGRAFGEDRLLASLLTHAALPMAGLLRGVVKDVTEFRNGGPADDLTIVAARAR